MKNPVTSRSIILWILLVLIFILAIGAIISGAMLFLAPDGRIVQMQVDVLSDSPFPVFFIPGIILFIFLGLFPLFTGYSLFKQPAWKSMNMVNPFKSLYWAWAASLVSGLILLIWIITETILIGYLSFLQPLMIIWGILIIFITVLPGVRRYYQRTS